VDEGILASALRHNQSEHDTLTGIARSRLRICYTVGATPKPTMGPPGPYPKSGQRRTTLDRHPDAAITGLIPSLPLLPLLPTARAVRRVGAVVAGQRRRRTAREASPSGARGAGGYQPTVCSSKS
jgi:hypothetical protein